MNPYFTSRNRDNGPNNGPFHPHEHGPCGPTRPSEAYALQADESGYIKIGKCSSHTRRNRWIDAQRLSGEPCTWLGLLDVTERYAHKKLDAYRIGGEWFEPSRAVLAFIDVYRIED